MLINVATLSEEFGHVGGSFENFPQSEKYQTSHGLTSDSDDAFMAKKVLYS